MSVPYFTTPTFDLTFTEEGLDLTQAHNVYVTFTAGKYELTKTGEDLTVQEKEILVKLTQAETGKLNAGSESEFVKVQANWTTPGGDRAGSKVKLFEMSEQLLKKVVE